jgi:hypothetical protein
MSGPTIFLTANGPGEVMGWARPFMRAIYERRPDAAMTAIVLPCAYATGHEAEMLRTLFPQARVVDPQTYGRFLIGRKVDGLARRPGVLQYLGGDLFHAVTIARRLDLLPMTYKFSRRSYARFFQRCFALDENNAKELRATGTPPDRVRIVGNLVADSVVGSLTHTPSPPGTGSGVCILPGSRPYEVRFLMPFFMAVARELARRRPALSITFVLSPFTSDDELRAGIQWQGDPHHGGVAGRFDPADSALWVEGSRFAIDRSSDYHAISHSQLVISIPGTKCMEAAVLGRPLLVAVPLNRVDEIAMNGIAAYLHRIPIIGRPLKRFIAYRVASRVATWAQPNIDAGRMVAPELCGMLAPVDVARKADEMLDDLHGLRLMGETLAGLYAKDLGASARLADEVLAMSDRVAAQQMAG